MAQLKLYTEEQVRKILKSTHIHTDNDVDMILPQFTPIKLPSDEEISKQAEDADDNDLSPIEEWERGAKWLKEQILNQTK